MLETWAPHDDLRTRLTSSFLLSFGRLNTFHSITEFPQKTAKIRACRLIYIQKINTPYSHRWSRKNEKVPILANASWKLLQSHPLLRNKLSVFHARLQTARAFCSSLTQTTKAPAVFLSVQNSHFSAISIHCRTTEHDCRKHPFPVTSRRSFTARIGNHQTRHTPTTQHAKIHAALGIGDWSLEFPEYDLQKGKTPCQHHSHYLFH